MSTDHSSLRLKSKLYYYAADVVAVYDGDTITVNLDLGLGIWDHGVTIRFWKINAPEVRGPEREKGLQVRDMVRELILNKSVLVRTILDKRGEDRTGKFGRLLGEVLVENERGAVIVVNDLLLGLGLAQPMGEDGSMAASRSVASPAPAQTIPTAVTCPFCGEERQVYASAGNVVETATAAQETAPESRPSPLSVTGFLVEECPNCLDEARPLGDFMRGSG